MPGLTSIVTMASDWLGLRAGERRDTFFGFATLLLVITGHAMLETARDTLFLSHLDVTDLPWAYLTIAALALLFGGSTSVGVSRWPRGRTLSLTLLGATVVTVGFWVACATRRPQTLFALYVWTGLVASAATLQFWLRAGDVFDVGRAKRVFAIIGAGALAGATIGAAIASVVLLAFSPRALILGGAAAFAVAAATNHRWGAVRRETAPRPDRSPAPPPRGTLRRDPYFWRILVLTVLATVAVTGVDYVFKVMVAHEVPRDQIGHFLARYMTAVNAAALLFQLLFAARLLQWLGVVGVLVLLPLSLLGATTVAAVAGGLVPALAVKAVDGTMRHSLDRAGTEILYLPLADGVRDRVKAVTAAVGQRGGQALASLAILAAISAGASPGRLTAGLAVLCAAWLGSLVGLRGLYVGRFRQQLRTLRTGVQGTLPPLDVRSLEVLIVALSSDDDAEVLGALDMLEAYGKVALISPLLVHHPSREVARRALALVDDPSRPDILRFIDRVLDRDDDDVRAAVLRLRTARRPDEALLRRHLRRARSPVVRCTALVGLIGGGFVDDREAERMLGEFLEHVTADAMPTLAPTLTDLPPRFARALARELVRNPDPRFGAEVAKALAAEPSATFLDTLLELVARRDARVHARAALVALGDPALDGLARALADPTTPDAVRLHLPRSISPFGNARAAAVLVEQLARERDDRMRYKLLRGLGRMRADDPTLPVDDKALLLVARGFLERAITLLAGRVACDALVADGRWPQRVLLPVLLAEEERRALESVFRVLHVMEPSAEYAVVCRGLAATNADARAVSRELLEHLVKGPLRPGLLALTDSLPPPGRLAAVLDVHEPPDVRALLELLGRESPPDELLPLLQLLLGRLATDPDAVVRSVAAYELDAVDWATRTAVATGGSDGA
jgi:AAA family ATP:ADP antiporter